jgi:AcrR family transcriptional regulator
MKAARRLFGQRGYGSVSIEEIVRASRVTRGALYHHFEDKADLFRTVAAEVENEVAEQVIESVDREKRLEKRFERGIEVTLDAFLDRSVRQILLIDGPSVVGWAAWVSVDERHTTRVLKEGLRIAIERKYLAPVSVDTLAHLLVGAITEAGLFIAASEDPERARRQAGKTIARLVRGLRQ